MGHNLRGSGRQRLETGELWATLFYFCDVECSQLSKSVQTRSDVSSVFESNSVELSHSSFLEFIVIQCVTLTIGSVTVRLTSIVLCKVLNNVFKLQSCDVSDLLIYTLCVDFLEQASVARVVVVPVAVELVAAVTTPRKKKTSTARFHCQLCRQT